MNLNDMAMWQWFAIAGGAVLLLSLIMYFLPAGKMKLPAVVTGSFGGLVAGLALGILLMAVFGYKPMREQPPSSDSAGGGPGPAGKMPGPGAPGFVKGPGGPMPKNAIGGPPPAPSPKAQLVALVTALDTVADRPVTITLTPEQKSTIVEKLKGLDQPAELTDDDAKARLDAIVKAVEREQKTLETVGFRTTPPAKGGFGPPKESPNPFKEGPTAERLKSLLERLDKKPG
jgi:hypothetical protein